MTYQATVLVQNTYYKHTRLCEVTTNTLSHLRLIRDLCLLFKPVKKTFDYTKREFGDIPDIPNSLEVLISVHIVNLYVRHNIVNPLDAIEIPKAYLDFYELFKSLTYHTYNDEDDLDEKFDVITTQNGIDVWDFEDNMVDCALLPYLNQLGLLRDFYTTYPVQLSFKQYDNLKPLPKNF